MKRLLLTFLVLILGAGSSFAILPGPISDFYTPRPGDTTAVVFGTRGLLPAVVKKLELLAHRNADYLKQKDPSRIVQVYADTSFPMALFGRRSLVLMGTPKSNTFLGEWRHVFPFILRDSRFNISGRKLYQGEDLTLSAIFPNPLANDRYVYLLVGSETWAQPSLADWPGDYDYYVAQRHSFWGWQLNRGKFQKNSSTWSQELVEYERSPHDTTTVVALVYPYGQVWYPARWEEDSLWDVPLTDRIALLAGLQSLFTGLERSIGLRVHGNVDFQLSDRYPAPSAYDPFGRVFLRTHPDLMDSSVFLSWGGPLARVLFPCADAPLDWELFAHRYLLTQNFFKQAGKLPRELVSAGAGRRWAEILTEGDSTHLLLLSRMVDRGLAGTIGEILDSVTDRGKKYSFKMSEFTAVLGRMVQDTQILRLAKLPLRPSPYERKPAFDLGVENIREMFLQEEVRVAAIGGKGAAFAAGLRKGDKIISVDGFPTNYNRSRAYLAWLGKKKGETLKLVIDRQGVRRTLVIPVS
ncbi:MAG TPA: PDZ domain-containing protein [Verrucomicrobiae bacterium]|nr:PDZ domain-containing protein [Verrucomicrobiae bacterium]